MMEFLVIAHDRTDDEALARHMVVRERRLAAARRAIRSGNVLFGGATLGEEGRMVGPMSVVALPARAAFDEWLRNAPHNKNGVWGRVGIRPYFAAVVADSGNGPKERADGHHDRSTNKET